MHTLHFMGYVGFVSHNGSPKNSRFIYLCIRSPLTLSLLKLHGIIYSI